MHVSLETAQSIVRERLDQSGERYYSITPCEQPFLGYAIRFDEAFWAFEIHPAQHWVGGCRYIVVSKETGRILFDEMVGE